MPASWRHRYSGKVMNEMGRFKQAVALTERPKTIIPDQSWSRKVQRMEPISETVRCREFEDNLLEEDSETGGKWEQHVQHKYLRNTAGVKPDEVIRPGHILQLETAKYCRRQLDEDYPSVFDDESEYSDDQYEGENVFILDTDDYMEFSIGYHDGRSDNDSAVSHKMSEAHSNTYQVDKNGSQGTSLSVSSSLVDALTDDLDAEREQLAAALAEFPTCIVRTKLLTSIDDEHHGLLAMIHDGAWSPISRDSLTTRVRQWIADFSSECPNTYAAHSQFL